MLTKARLREIETLSLTPIGFLSSRRESQNAGAVARHYFPEKDKVPVLIGIGGGINFFRKDAQQADSYEFQTVIPTVPAEGFTPRAPAKSFGTQC
jgi:hypothetical protein